MKKRVNLLLMKKLYLVLLSILVVIAAFNVVQFFSSHQEKEIIIVEPNISLPTVNKTQPVYPPTKIIEACSSNADCSWLITNCCSENAGAHWECLNKETYIDCKSRETLCIQVISPKPSSSCSCVNNVCSTV